MVEGHRNTLIELFLAAENLLDKDVTSQSDPYCVVSLQIAGTESFRELIRTEVITDCLNPTWRTTVTLEYHFELNQMLKFEVFDYDGDTSEDLGCVVISVNQIVSKMINKVKLPTQGMLKIVVEEKKISSEGFQVSFKGYNLDRMDFLGKSDPYLIIYKYIGDDSWAEAGRTDVVMNNLNPEWKPLTLSIQKLCNVDRLKPVKVECFDWDKHNHEFIGSAEVNVTQLTSEGYQFELWGKNKSKGKNSGWIQVNNIVFGKFPTSLIDYLQSGLTISLSIAVDFRDSSNTNNKSSLHHQSPNQFVQALREIGSRLEVFDSDKLIPIYGFSGFPNKETSKKCFALNFNEKNAYVSGIESAILTYEEAVSKISSSKSSNFHDVIDRLVHECKEMHKNTEVYHILLVLATGEIDDIEETFQSVMKSCYLPISVIVAGIGSESFGRMMEFEEKCLKRCRCDDLRENFQVVRFSDFRGEDLAAAAEVLRKIPRHVVEYMEKVNYRPLLQSGLNYS